MDAFHLVPGNLNKSRLQELPDLSLFHYWFILSFLNPVCRYKDVVDLCGGKEGIEELNLIFISGN